jgi:hypothetical protein
MMIYIYAMQIYKKHLFILIVIFLSKVSCTCQTKSTTDGDMGMADATTAKDRAIDYQASDRDSSPGHDLAKDKNSILNDKNGLLTGWSKRFGDSQRQKGNRVAIDASGNVFLSGIFGGTIDLGGGPFKAEGQYDGFIAKFNPSGKLLWSQHLKPTQITWDAGIEKPTGPLYVDHLAFSVDLSGNVFIAGISAGSIDFGGQKVDLNANSAFMARYDSQGKLLWARRIGGQSAFDSFKIASIAAAPTGNLVLCGTFSGNLDLGGGPLQGQVYWATLDPSGAHLFSKGFKIDQAAFAPAEGNFLAVDPSGNSFITGMFYGNADFGGGNRTGAFYVVKLSTTGSHIWSKGFGTKDSLTFASIAIDSAGSVLLGGEMSATLDFGGNPLQTSAANDGDLFLAKLDSAGNHLWSKRFGGSSGTEFATNVCVDAKKSISLIGNATGPIDFGGGLLSGTGNKNDEDVVLAKFDSAGQHLWSMRSAPDPSSQSGTGIACESAGSLFITGGFFAHLDLGFGTLNSAGDMDLFLARITPP